MTPLTAFLKRYSLLAGILLMFLLTWPLEAAASGLLPVQLPFFVVVTYGWGLSIAALLVTALTLGRRAVLDLLKRFLIWRVGLRWYAVAFLLFPAIFVSAVLLTAARTGQPPDFSGVMAHKIFGASASLPAFVLPFFIFDLLTNGEELAWRGFVLPRLQARHSALVSSLLLGLVWALWHMPRYFAPGNTGSFAWLVVKVLAETVIYTWVFNSTRGSLLLTSILHAAGNTAGAFLPIASTLSGAHLDAYITLIALEILVAIAVTLATGPLRLSRPDTIQSF